MNTAVANDPAPAEAAHRAHLTPAARSGSLRRRLWELPAASHDLLLALSLTPAQLQAVVERCLSRLHRARCQLAGSAADVLFSSVRDLGTRNPLSEALQRELDIRHAAATRTLGGLRDAEALRTAWVQALAGPGNELPAALWALLTHPHGAGLEDAALVDARAWVYAQARAGLAAGMQANRQTTQHAEALADNASLRARLTAAQSAAQQQSTALHREIAQLRGALQRAEQQARAGAANPAAAAGPRCAWLAPAPPACAPPRRQPVLPAGRADTLPDPEVAPAAAPAPAAPRQNWSPSITGQRVLCVGGMPGAQRRYQAIVEAGGGHFAWHDGGLEDRVQRLDQQLQGADLVVCQAGCLNHEAYRRIKGHCKRLGKPCLYLQRPSLSSFARSLGLQGQGTG